jgi:hypothetical protein
MEELKRGLVDMYSCLSFAINGKSHNPRNEHLFHHFPILATFVIQTCDASQHPTIVHYLINIVILKNLFIFNI